MEESLLTIPSSKILNMLVVHRARRHLVTFNKGLEFTFVFDILTFVQNLKVVEKMLAAIEEKQKKEALAWYETAINHKAKTLQQDIQLAVQLIEDTDDVEEARKILNHILLEYGELDLFVDPSGFFNLELDLEALLEEE